MSPPDDAEVQAAFQKFLSEYLGPDDKRLGSYWFTMPGEIWRQGVAWASARVREDAGDVHTYKAVAGMALISATIYKFASWLLNRLPESEQKQELAEELAQLRGVIKEMDDVAAELRP